MHDVTHRGDTASVLLLSVPVMNTDTASVQIPRSRTTTSLSDLTEQIPQWAEEHGLVPIPALPGDFVGLERDGVPLSDLGARECVALAARLGARGLYFEAETFHPDLFVPLDEEEEEEEELSDQLRTNLKELRKAARRHTGQLESVGIFFCSGIIPHGWVQEASWMQELEVKRNEFNVARAEERQEQRAQLAEQREEAVAQQEKDVRKLAMTLAQDETFRAAKRTQRMSVAERAFPAGPEVLEDREAAVAHRRLLYGAVDAAGLMVDEAAARIFQDYESRLEELAKMIEDVDALQGARTAATRRIRIRDFLTQRSGGYPAPTRTVDLLLEHIKHRPKQASLM